MILRLCCVAVITAVCAMILKANKPEFVPMCLTAGGIIIILFGFDYLSASVEFIRQFTEQTGILDFFIGCSYRQSPRFGTGSKQSRRLLADNVEIHRLGKLKIANVGKL